MRFEEAIEGVGKVIDAAGIAIIVLGVLVAAGNSLLRWRWDGASEAYLACRRVLGRAILLGLEILVAADIIRTVALAPTIENLVVLAGIVLIRTFLGFALELEIEGRWPWQRRGPA